MSDPESQERESDEEQEDFQQLQVRDIFFYTVWSKMTEVHIYVSVSAKCKNVLLSEIKKDFNCVQ